jgi:hypothetical protein
MPNCTNWLVSYPATLLRNQGCRVHQQARSWLQERLAGAQFYPGPNCPIKLSGSSILIVLIFQENAKEVMPVFQNLLNFSNQNHTFLIALI